MSIMDILSIFPFDPEMTIGEASILLFIAVCWLVGKLGE